MIGLTALSLTTQTQFLIFQLVPKDFLQILQYRLCRQNKLHLGPKLILFP